MMASCAKDFIGIHNNLKSLHRRSGTLASDFNGVAAIVLNREALKEANRSIREARSVRVLTLLGMLFLPLSYASSLLSMATDFLPGAKNFWIYFCIAIPLILVVALGAVLVSSGSFGEESWFGRKIHKRVKRRSRTH
jgi:Mg2+ and Co2+ transporter CorA